MDKGLDNQELRKLVKELMLKKLIKEDDDDELGIYGGGFDAHEFDTNAMNAAMRDIAASGEKFEPLGKSKFEKNLDVDAMKNDLTMANLNLPKEKEKTKKIQQNLDKRYKHEKQFGVGSLNENEDSKNFTDFDTSNLYKFLKDAMYYIETNALDYAEGAHLLETALIEKFDVVKKNKFNYSLNENPNVNPNSKINRPKDAEGTDITNGARVEDLATGTVGRVLHPGVDENGNLTIHVDWVYNFGDAIVKPVVYPNKIVVRDDTRVVREDEVEEGIGHSHTVGRGQNIKPGNYPQTLKRVGIKENLDQAAPMVDDEVFIVIDSPFNRAHYKDLIGKTFSDSPAYAQTKVIKKNEAEALENTNSLAEEDSDFSTSEREHHGEQELNTLANATEQQVPQELLKFIIPGSFNETDADDDGRYEISFSLKIPKQSDETIKDVESFIREYIPTDIGGPGQSYQKTNIYTELEKGTNKWIVNVNVARGYDI